MDSDNFYPADYDIDNQQDFEDVPIIQEHNVWERTAPTNVGAATTPFNKNLDKLTATSNEHFVGSVLAAIEILGNISKAQDDILAITNLQKNALVENISKIPHSEGISDTQWLNATAYVLGSLILSGTDISRENFKKLEQFKKEIKEQTTVELNDIIRYANYWRLQIFRS